MILHEIFRVVSHFPATFHVISWKIDFLWDSVVCSFLYYGLSTAIYTDQKKIHFPRYSGENVILRRIVHVVSCFPQFMQYHVFHSSCSIMVSTIFHVISRKFGLLFGQCILFTGLGTAFFYVLNASFFCVLLKHTTFFCVLFSSFWGLMRPKRTMRSFAFFS